MAKRYSRQLVAHAPATDWLIRARFAGSDHCDLAGDCERPVFRCLTGLRDSRVQRLGAIGKALAADPFIDWDGFRGFHLSGTNKGIDVAVDPNQPINVDLAVRCRKCGKCLAARAAHWRLRSYAETKRASRTWFGTLTLSPGEQFKAISAARVHLAAQRLDFDALSPADQFGERHRQINLLLTKYIKRVRKSEGVPIKYLLVAEAHKSGAPHYHVLIHEQAGPVRHRVLQSQWVHGFSNWKLVRDERAASYVCKYLAKSALARVRASKKYGELSADSDPGATLAQPPKRKPSF